MEKCIFDLYLINPNPNPRFRSGLATTALAQQVLAEIPDQLLEFMAKRKITPNSTKSH
jgi:hypothetical protein